MLHILFLEKNLSERILVQSRIPDFCLIVTIQNIEALIDLLPVAEVDAIVIGSTEPPDIVKSLVEKVKKVKPALRTLVLVRNVSGVDYTTVFGVDGYELLFIPEELGGLQVFFNEIAKARLDVATANRSCEVNRMLSRLVGSSAQMSTVKDTIIKYAGAPGPVLITGESGTGKEIAARLIHDFSGRRGSVFHAVNASAIPRDLSATEFFGSAAGAYTGAVKRGGVFEYADGGTLFLDEIAELEYNVQTELLRVIETGLVRRVGSNDKKKIDVRLISATNINLSEAVKTGKFRNDLLYRIDMFRIHIPPLRERKEDIPDLLMCFSEQLRKERPNRVYEFSDSFIDSLFDHDWPGNVRELINVFRRAVYTSDSGILTADSIRFF